MQDIIRTGDKTSSGGTVLAGSSTMIFGGIGVARVGDPVSCPVHGFTAIGQGHESFTDNGVAVAFDGHACDCGCTLISSFPDASVR
ncbi:PAAR domain-containing protein [Pseudomonas putida]